MLLRGFNLLCCMSCLVRGVVDRHDLVVDDAKFMFGHFHTPKEPIPFALKCFEHGQIGVGVMLKLDG